MAFHPAALKSLVNFFRIVSVQRGTHDGDRLRDTCRCSPRTLKCRGIKRRQANGGLSTATA
jgi:hypothetical protein